ncbi:MAG: heterodisulfide reductase-related iron-sulfur binding cluster [Thaumarchaeota archaeon]|nr:heterodisulfide reductase-related iron-sulfur binding cluster [Nitrososphaerota archaeon]
MSDPVRASYLFLPWYAPEVLYATFFICGVVMLYGLFRHLQNYGIGPRQFLVLVSKNLSKKVGRFAEYGLAQRKVLAGGEGGVMHGAIFFGFLMLLAYTSLVFVQSDILPLFTSAVFLQGGFYLTLEFFGDVLGLAFVVGLGIALYRRFVQKPEKLKTAWDDYVVLGLLVWIGISGFVLESLRFVALPSQFALYSPVGNALSILVGELVSGSQATIVYQGFWWVHMFSVFGLIAVVPYTKLVHVFTSGANVAVAEQKPMGRLNTPFSLAAMIETGSVETPPNVRSSGDFQPLQLLALDACTNCGRCQEVCPAYAAGRDLSPRLVVQDLGADMRAGAGDALSRGTIREQELWSCTTCNACVNACPVLINQVDYIVEFRRTLVAENRLDPMKRAFLENIGRSNNPFGLPQSDRQTWLTEMGVPTIRENPGAEYLYWVGCQGSYDPRARKITSSVIEIMKAANVDFAVLGNEEVCTGEPVRRMGEEARFQELALRNVETLKQAGTKKVVVHCAHCFNTFLNEYPELGARFEVIHHSQLIWELTKAGRLPPGSAKRKVTFHDPCNLGRINGVFEEPREVLGSQEGLQLVEMKRSRANSFCCGGGGANVWYQVPEKKKIGVIRVEEAVETGADTMAVGCPFCVAMFEDAAKTLGNETLEIRDIAEIVAEGLPKG